MFSRMRVAPVVALAVVTAWATAATADGRAVATTSDSVAGGDDGEPLVRSKAKRKAKRKRKRGRARERRLTVTLNEARLFAGSGALHGEGVLPASSAVVMVGSDLESRAEWRNFRLSAPVRLGHRETPGADLRETSARARLALRWRHSALLRVTGEAGVSGAYRPGWPDPYQPTGDGDLAATDRRSYWERGVGLKLASMPRKRHHVRLGYSYDITDYRDDDNFEAIDAPMHLVPADHDRHRVAGSWRLHRRPWGVRAEVEAYSKHYFFVFARDAGTGATHAAPGGASPNPLQNLRGVEPSVELELEHGDSVDLELGYGFEVVEDTFEGYYSYTGHHPSARLRWRPEKRWSVAAKADLRLRRYGPNSYAEGPSHPPLTFGDRRVDRRLSSSLEVAYTLSRHLSVVGDLDAVVRRTNFPAYQPGVFPSSRDYDVDWNYVNAQLVLGLAYAYR